MASGTSTLGRWLEPFVSGLWVFFLVWTAWIACVWSFAIGDAELARWIGNRDLRTALEWLVGIGDIAWITLAAANVHLWVAETEGLPTARRWALTVGGGIAALGALSAWSGFPLGEIQYSSRLGVKLGPVPLGLPLLWYALIIGARQTALRWWPAMGQMRLALATGTLACLADWMIEPVAAKVRGFWFWRADTLGFPPHFAPSWTNCAAWFVVASGLAFALREERVAVSSRGHSFRPIAIFVLLNSVFLAANLGRFLRG